MNISLLIPYRKKDIWNIPLSFNNEFKRRGFNTKIYTTLKDDSENITLDGSAWSEDGLKQLLKDAKDGVFIPDIIFHCDFGLFRSNFLNKSFFPTAKWICEAGDDPQCYNYNLEKISKGNFDLIHSPDIRSVQNYLKLGYNAVWCPHFADQTLITDEIDPIYDAITSRHYSEDFFKALKIQLGDRFIARDTFLEAHDHFKFLKQGKIVVQNSKYKEITRRIFEGMICNRLVITDRPHFNTRIDLIFKENEDIVYFDNIEDCVNKINYYINNEDERKRITKNAYKKVMEKHTVSKRIEKLLQIL